MKNKTSKTKIIILIVIAIVVVFLIGFLVYRNKSRTEERSGGLFSNVFSILPSSREITPLETFAGINIKKDEPVYVSGVDSEGNLIISPARGFDLGKIYGYANRDIKMGEIGDIRVNKDYTHGADLSDFKFQCSDGIDNDGDGLIDDKDPNCHLDGDINKEYLPNHYSESYPPFVMPEIADMGPNELLGACSDGIDNDGDGLIDEEDPNCHLDGDINKEYLPNHYSESRYATSYIDLSVGPVTFDSVKTDEKTTFYATIYNYGTHSTGSSFYSFFQIQKIKERSTEDVYIETFRVPEIKGGGDYVSSFTYQIKDENIYQVRACVDKKDPSDDGTIKEINENNNCGGWVSFSLDSSIPDMEKETLPQCSDGIDNDGDGLIDEEDPDCYTGGTLEGRYLPLHDSESERPYQCSDGIDNDGDGLIDEEDPDCYTGGTLEGRYLPGHDSEDHPPLEPNICLKLLPLNFTPEEKADLDDLLRRFYLLAPELKDQDDVKVVYRELKQYQLLREETELLIDECKKDVQALKDKGYGDMIIQYGNPWYNYDDRGSYLEKIDESILASFEPRCEFYKPFEDSAGSDALTKNKNWLKRATGKDKDLSENEKKQICGKLGMSNSRLVCEIYDSYNPQEYWSEVVENPENHYTYGNAFIKFWRWLVGKGEDDIARWKQTGCRWVINEKTYVQEYEALLNVW